MHIFNPWPSTIWKKLFALLWSLPWGLIAGVLFPILFLLTGNKLTVSINNGGIDCIVTGWYSRRKSKQGWGAVTLGWNMYYWGPDMYVREIRVHERFHIRQLLKYGLAMPILYLYYSFKHGYNENPLEIEAYKGAAEFIAANPDNISLE